jgi:hypothetical protein
VGAGVEQHPLERQALLGLFIRALGDSHTGAMEAAGQLVADDLELPQVQQPRLRGEGDRWLEPAHRKGSDERVRELTLETRDLGPQRPASCALVPLAHPLAEPGRPHRKDGRGGVGHELGDLLYAHHGGD